MPRAQATDEATMIPENRTPNQIPETTKAATFRRYGLPHVVEVVDRDLPDLGPGDVLVRVAAAALNPLDVHLMTGTPWLVRPQAGLRAPKDGRIGVDFAGEVLATGDTDGKLRPGDEVMGVAQGTCAQYAIADVGRITPKPADVDWHQAASVGVAGVTALQGLRDKAKLQAGQSVLINGASGGVGTAAIQIAKDLGAHVTAVCSGRNIEMVTRLGADVAIDYTTTDFVDTSRTYDVFFDNQGNKPIGACKRLVASGGTYLLVGGPKRNRVWGPVGRMIATLGRFTISGKKAKMFVASENGADIALLAEMMASGRLHMPIDSVYPLTEIEEALDHLSEGHAAGKVIVEP